eukprot:768438-Hanusia_phi.AAC.9
MSRLLQLGRSLLMCLLGMVARSCRQRLSLRRRTKWKRVGEWRGGEVEGKVRSLKALGREGVQRVEGGWGKGGKSWGGSGGSGGEMGKGRKTLRREGRKRVGGVSGVSGGDGGEERKELGRERVEGAERGGANGVEEVRGLRELGGIGGKNRDIHCFSVFAQSSRLDEADSLSCRAVIAAVCLGMVFGKGKAAWRKQQI